MSIDKPIDRRKKKIYRMERKTIKLNFIEKFNVHLLLLFNVVFSH